MASETNTVTALKKFCASTKKYLKEVQAQLGHADEVFVQEALLPSLKGLKEVLVKTEFFLDTFVGKEWREQVQLDAPVVLVMKKDDSGTDNRFKKLEMD